MKSAICILSKYTNNNARERNNSRLSAWDMTKFIRRGLGVSASLYDGGTQLIRPVAESAASTSSSFGRPRFLYPCRGPRERREPHCLQPSHRMALALLDACRSPNRGLPGLVGAIEVHLGPAGEGLHQRQDFVRRRRCHQLRVTGESMECHSASVIRHG